MNTRYPKQEEKMKNHIVKNNSGFAIAEMFLIAVLVFGIAGIGFYVYRQAQEDSLANTESVEQVNQVETLPENLNEVLQVSEIISAVDKDSPDDPIVDIDLESEDSKVMFIVKLKSGKTLYVDAKSAAIVRTRNGEPSSDAVLPASLGDLISLAEAQRIASEKYPGVKIIKIELELDDGKWEYEVKFTTGVKVEVSATDGAVTKIKNEEKTYIGNDIEKFEKDSKEKRSNKSNENQAENKPDDNSNESETDSEDKNEDDDGNDDDNRDNDEN